MEPHLNITVVILISIDAQCLNAVSTITLNVFKATNNPVLTRVQFIGQAYPTIQKTRTLKITKNANMLPGIPFNFIGKRDSSTQRG